MKYSKKYLFFVFVLISAKFSSSNNYILSSDYIVTIHGTSNLHDWEETVGKVTGNGTVNWNDDGSVDLDVISIKIDVYSIKSESSIMSNNTYKALKADENPEIIFTLTEPIRLIKTRPGANTVSAKGNLTIAGVTKSITMQVNVFIPEQGKLVFQGSEIIRMTDYGMTPPTALFGALKTGDDITLDFKTSFVINNQFNKDSNLKP